MDSRRITFQGAGVHHVEPPVRWAWVVALSVAAVGGTYEGAAGPASAAQSPTALGMSSVHPNTRFAETRT